MPAPKPPRKLDPRQLRCRAKQDAFLKVFERLGSVGATCAETGVSVHTYDQWLHADIQGFKTRRDQAAIIAMGVLEREILRRAVEGTDRDVYYKGQVVGQERQYSDNLLMFRAKKLDPSYKDNYVPSEDRPTSVTQINIHLHPSVSPNPLVDANTVIDSIPRPRRQDSLPQDLSVD